MVPSLDDELELFWAEQITQLILESAWQYLKANLIAQFDLKTITMMNPGSLEDWPLPEQKKLFQILGNPEALIDVKLTEDYLMKPVKSLSGIFFVNNEGYENCRLCPKENCPDRRASYDQMLSHDKYHLS